MQNAKKILIVASGNRKNKYQKELKEKFYTNFTIINKELMDARGENIWKEENYCIASMDFLKRDDIIQKLEAARWDLVVIDEAHKMSAYSCSTKNGKGIVKSLRYRVGEIFAQNSTHMLFLTPPCKGVDCADPNM